MFISILFQSPQDAVTPFQILGGEAQIVQVLLRHKIFLLFLQGHRIFNKIYIFAIFFLSLDNAEATRKGYCKAW